MHTLRRADLRRSRPHCLGGDSRRQRAGQGRPATDPGCQAQAAGDYGMLGVDRGRCLPGRDRGPEEFEAVAQFAERRFLRRGREFGLDPPRGILLLGVQGCGKSLCAKVVASAWHMPLMRMDPGMLYQKFVGESEARLREALQQAESMAPVVLWVDEIEKAFASATSDSADGGLSQRMFGTLLSWMQDHRQPIFLIATANNLARLPPELMWKGRSTRSSSSICPRRRARSHLLDPRQKAATRQEQVHIADSWRIGRVPSAEIEQAVVSGLYAAFADKVECTTERRCWRPSARPSLFPSSCGSMSSSWTWAEPVAAQWAIEYFCRASCQRRTI